MSDDDAMGLFLEWLKAEIMSTECMNSGYIRAERLRILYRVNQMARRLRGVAKRKALGGA